MKHTYTLAAVLCLSVFGLFVFSQRAIFNFLDLKKVSNLPQSTVILDRDGKELFRFFEEDRRRLPYEAISPYMVEAIVAAEDQTFWTNDGVDAASLLRAVINNIKVSRNNSGQLQGGSTITQQIIKNIFLTKQKTVKRKLKELILATYLTKKISSQYQRSDDLSRNDAQTKAKEYLISTYLNYIYFGNHAYGIDAAARHYFHTSAKDLSRIQSAILAGMPQAPSLYNPVVDPTVLLGYRSVPSWMLITGSALITPVYTDILEPYTHTFLPLTINHPAASEKILSLTKKPLILSPNCLDSIKRWASLETPYHLGRKDRVLCRMREQKMLTTEELKQTFLDAQHLIFYKASFNISAPHFIYRTKQFVLNIPYFKEREFTEQQLSQAGLTIWTTLDSHTQQLAQDANENYMGMLRRNGGTNRALLHIDTTNGDVLSYIGSVDFYNDAIAGQVDVIRALRQIGSTIKPLLYAYLFTHYPFAIDGSIVDGPLTSQGPNNFDKQFRGKITVATALASSRNLPVVRMFLALGKDEVFVPYLQRLGFRDLDMANRYSYALALGAAETRLLDLAQAYVQLSVTGPLYPTIDPILRVTDNTGELLYVKSGKSNKKLIPDTVGDMIWRILSDKKYMPADRRWLRQLPVEHIALKTGTTDKKIGAASYPRDALSVVYTPADLVITRAGNSDGRAMGPEAFGGEINHYVIRQYLQGLVASGMIADIPRETTTHYLSGGVYAGVDHREEFTPEQKNLFRRF